MPTCLKPEVRPSWWTDACGDAGYQLTMTWDSWSDSSATAHGRAAITHGYLAGHSWAMRVVFDRPQRVKGFGSRLLFSRARVTYLDGRGPYGHRTETISLEKVWTDSLYIRNMQPTT